MIAGGAEDPLAHAQRLITGGAWAEAESACRALLREQPGSARARALLGEALAAQGRTAEATNQLKMALALDPSMPEAHDALGRAMDAGGQWEEALAHFRCALEAAPDFVPAHVDVGRVLIALGQHDEAIAAFRRALALAPDDVNALTKYGVLQQDQERLEASIDLFSRAVVAAPHDPHARYNLASSLVKAGRVREALNQYREALRLNPDFALAHRNLLFALHYSPQVSAQEIYAEHLAYASRHASLPEAQGARFDNDRTPQRRLRVGYVSADFRTHSVAFYIQPLLEAHDRSQVEVFVYASVERPDAQTCALRQQVDTWRDIHAVPDAVAAAQARKDGIDILVDLGGYTANTRIGILWHRPAPIQVTYIGYPDTSGAAAVDYRLTDSWADPPGQADALHVETLVRLPGGFLCYAPPAAAPPVADPPVASSGQVTFGSFNNLPKITPDLIALWATVMAAVPDSRLILKSAGLQDARVRERLETTFEVYGVARERLTMGGLVADMGEHLASYHKVDIALDSFPYNGTTTTCEAMWMGVPVVTLAGDRHASRVGASLLQRVGLADLICDSPDEYVARAAALASDRAGLAALRATLRPRVEQALTDAPRFARSVETAYRAMWQRWCAGPATV